MSSKTAKQSKLEELRRLRDSKKTRLSSYQTQDEENLFDELDEEEYRRAQRSKLDEDDFVVDDNGEGYVENGFEWDAHDPNDESGSDDETAPQNRLRGKRKREVEKPLRKDQEGGINKYFTTMARQAASKQKTETTLDDQDFMNTLLGELDDHRDAPPSTKKFKRHNPESTIRHARALSPARPPRNIKVELNSEIDSFMTSSPPPRFHQQRTVDHASPPHASNAVTDVDALGETSIIEMNEESNSALGLIPKIKSESDDENDDSGITVRPISNFSKAERPGAIMNAVRPENLPQAKAVPKTNEKTFLDPTDASQWRDLKNSLPTYQSEGHSENSLPGKLAGKEVVRPDGAIRFFWIDFTEIGGSLCLFGKIQVLGTGLYTSAFLKINGLLRKLYFLPRVTKANTGEEVEMKDVHEEVDTLFTRLKISSGSDWKAKSCSRKYAFELPDIPKESDYLKVLYPYDRPQLPPDTTGDTFSHVFGTGTSLFEQFVLARNIMGPCWLQIERPVFSGVENASWCKLEFQVASPNNITPLPDSENLDPPPLRLMSLALRTRINPRDSKQEIIAISGRVYENISLSETLPAEKLPSSQFTICCPIGASFPNGFQKEVEQQKIVIRMEQTETSLLSSFLAKLQITDPDALIGHQLEESVYGTLIHRLKECKTLGWHRIGRMRRAQWPNNLGRGGYFVERQILAGRLVCDLANDLGKSLMSKCQSWSLTEMCDLIIGKKRIELDNETSLKTWASTSSGYLNYLDHASADTFMIASIALRIQILPLAKQLTNLAGNSWARTLSGTRAERNEYILLHEFTRSKYICPDKMHDKTKGAQHKIPEDDGVGHDDENVTDGKKKDKFKGGLVLEPEKGLYDRFILVMDFNSLYPSIIQEYNICFTTVDRNDLPEDQVPEVPREQDLGILPRLISTLVQRRKQVKSLMKDKKATAAELSQWDIKQQALKLTANSMYGCLGYVRSRFYARPLAMLTTFQGREILRSTKELAETLQLRVIYGDTDSVMINTNVDNYADALKIGNDFKKSVNERYKLLEIDIDNVFQRLLLHSKKKYAALNFALDGSTSVEVKGLDMRRREYCQLSKDVSSAILKDILSGDDQDIVIERIHDYLRDIAQKVRGNLIPIAKYTIYTKLSKDPGMYPGGKSMPQVQVALRRRARGDTVKANEVIAFIITGEGGNAANPADRAYGPQDLKTNPELKPDAEWYLLKQIFPPIERLCGPIDGTDAIRLAECLGLDARKYQIAASAPQAEQEMHPLESTLSDEERFKDAQTLSLVCLGCNETFHFEGLNQSLSMCTNDGIKCQTPKCSRVLPNSALITQVETNIRNYTASYYESWLRCDDPSCSTRTRQICVYGKRCLGPQGLASGCLGITSYEKSDKMLYNQLLYLSSLFDVDKAKSKATGPDREAVLVIAEHYRRNFGFVHRTIELYRKKCGRTWVQMENIFALH